MGGVRVNVDDILSFPDLHDKAFRHFNPANRPYSVRLSPLTVIWLAERGHWIPISKKKIDDKSKADYFQKLLVMTQVLWMIMQCIMRKIHHLTLSLLEVHTMVHVVCAVFLYMCWFRVRSKNWTLTSLLTADRNLSIFNSQRLSDRRRSGER